MPQSYGVNLTGINSNLNVHSRSVQYLRDSYRLFIWGSSFSQLAKLFSISIVLSAKSHCKLTLSYPLTGGESDKPICVCKVQTIVQILCKKCIWFCIVLLEYNRFYYYLQCCINIYSMLPILHFWQTIEYVIMQKE